ncbi:tetratricopeptide repeat protein [Nannocystis bainbridge]|uniref:Tetratricopeptide repeat protein n=1 Tax=Nannocystis bainbridge TaxID=2995303 RepID=A0ABT5E9G6_9BACT|nr:tetratricopeptide repeat protein [Nannocystis bainbridge]MDC0722498.1 tetratricopeptide repeat protein [Nannocystis bainbridge]
MSSQRSSSPPVEVLIVTALRMERDAVKAVSTGALGVWSEERVPGTGLRVERRSFAAADGARLTVALICAEDMGGTQTAGVAGPVVMALRPRCLAMCGVLAGKPGDTEFGDVVFADQLLLHDSGKRTAKGFQHGTRPHVMDIRWVEKARDFAEDPGDALAWLRGPDWTVDQQRAWLLDQFARGRGSQSLGPLLAECCPEYESIVAGLLAEELVHPGDQPLTEQGKKHVDAERFKSQRWPGLDPPRRSLRVHVGPIASGNAVQGDEVLWDELETFARKVLGVEMEAHAVANTAELLQLELAVVMKGVMDHADKHKDDRFKSFAARASAECLLAFLRRNSATRVRTGYDDILSPGTATLPDDPSPSRLLHPSYEVVKFFRAGRKDILAELDEWCTTGKAVQGRLVHGPGGFGKTRLAIEWTRDLRERGWAAGFLHAHVVEDWFDRVVGLGMPVAVVIDYAESRAELRQLLAPVLQYASARVKLPVRILLLARGVDDWWQALLEGDESRRAFLTAVPPVPLRPLADGSEVRVEVFRAAAAEFAARRGRTAPTVSRALTDPIFDRALYIHMAALAAVDELDLQPPRKAEEEPLLAAILEHEERFWDERQKRHDRQHRLHVERARRLVAAATLRGGLPTREVANAIGTRLRAADEDLLMLLHDVYGAPGSGGGPGTYVGPLEPDLLGEGMVRRTYRRMDEPRENYIDGVFEDADADRLRHGFEALGRAAVGEKPVVRPWIDRLLARETATRALLAFAAAKAVGRRTALSVLGDALADALERAGDARVAAALEHDGIPTQTVTLRRVAVWVSRALLAAAPDGEEENFLSQRAHVLNNLGNRQSEVGQREAALASTAEAVRIYEELAKRNPDAFQPDLAMSLNNLGNRQGEVGQREAALVSVAEAVRIFEELAKRNPDAFQPDLAASLNNLGAMQSEVGQREAALVSTVESVRLRRELAKRNPDAFQPDLAASLNNLGNRQSEVGQREAALAEAAEAVRIYEELAKRNPDAFQPDLAASLNNLGPIQSGVGRREEALASAAEAVRIYEELAKRNPDAFQPDLALSLNNFSAMQSEVGQREAALASVAESVRIYEELAKRNPDAFQPDLAASLNNLGNRQSEVGQRKAALASVAEAVRLRRELAKRNPDAFQPDLAASLNNLGIMQSEVGQPEAALTSAAEGVRVYEELAKRNPDAFHPDLAASLSNLGNRQSQVGQPEAALASVAEAVRIYEELAKRNPDAFQPHLAASLNNLGNRQSEAGRREAALASVAEAVRIRRELAKRNPDAFQPGLAISLNNLGIMQSEVGQPEVALASAAEGVRIYEELAKGNPGVFHPELAASLNNLGSRQSEVGQREAALESVAEAVRIYEELAKQNPDAFQPHLAMSLNNLGAMQSEVGQREAALASMAEAVRIRRELAKRNPDAFQPHLAMSLNNLGAMQSEVGQREAALASAAETFDLYWPHFAAHPENFARNMMISLRNLLRRQRDAGLAPDAALLERVGVLRGLGLDMPLDLDSG